MKGGRISRWGRLARAGRFGLAGVVCWAALIALALGLLKIKADEAAAARGPLPAPRVALSPRMRHVWEHFPKFHDVVPVLLYHGINAEGDYLSLSRWRFAQQMLALHAAGFHTVSMAQYARYARTGSTRGLPSNPILLTFDDGRLDSYRGADRTLARFHFRATMFAVASWAEDRTGWSLSWSELAKMQESGRWDVQEHAGAGHRHIRVDAAGARREFYAYRGWSARGRESFAAYKRRVTRDVARGERMLRENVPGYRPLAFAVPYSNYGQRKTNDPRIPRFFLSFLHSRFAAVMSGDYLQEGQGRVSKVPGWKGHPIAYRLREGPVDTVQVLACRLRDMVVGVPPARESRCLARGRGKSPSRASD